MKTLSKYSFFVLTALVITTTTRAQTADEIVAKNLQAIGGRDIINSVKSAVIESDIDFNGNDAPSTTYIIAGKGFKSEMDFGGTKIVNCITDKGGWMINPMQGSTTATAMPADAVKGAQSQLQIVPLANYTENGGKLELLGKDTADYKIRFTNASGFDGTFFINMKSYLIDRLDTKFNMGGQSMDITLRFSHYQKTDVGLLVPFQVERELPQITLTATCKKIEINKPIDPSIFEMPK